MKYTFFTLLLVSLGFSINAQERAKSPAAKTEQRVGLTDISVEYSRPSMKERTIFGADGLVPYGKMWRTGANSATKITFSDDVEIHGTAIAKGSYALVTIPTATSWTINFYPYEGSRWSTYKEATPTASVQTESAPMSEAMESFMIAFDMLTDNSAMMFLLWENTVVPIEIKVK